MSEDKLHLATKRLLYRKLDDLTTINDNDRRTTLSYSENDQLRVIIFKNDSRVYYSAVIIEKVLKFLPTITKSDFEMIFKCWIEEKFQIKVSYAWSIYPDDDN